MNSCRRHQDKTLPGLSQAALDLDDLIMEVFEALHVKRGYRLMQYWNFPAIYCNVIREVTRCWRLSPL
jgi:HD-like signal output (HDOD) protein